MNTIHKNKLTDEEQKFVDGLSEYLDTDLYYYGSIQRNDYNAGESDIDILIMEFFKKFKIIYMLIRVNLGGFYGN